MDVFLTILGSSFMKLGAILKYLETKFVALNSTCRENSCLNEENMCLNYSTTLQETKIDLKT